MAEIGLDASRAEKNLEKLFYLATKWEAILLVDEADVFLETRGSTPDASRNALVSVLLRVLEYYKGILVLTTNMAEQVDRAFESTFPLSTMPSQTLTHAGHHRSNPLLGPLSRAWDRRA